MFVIGWSYIRVLLLGVLCEAMWGGVLLSCLVCDDDTESHVIWFYWRTIRHIGLAYWDSEVMCDGELRIPWPVILSVHVIPNGVVSVCCS